MSKRGIWVSTIAIVIFTLFTARPAAPQGTMRGTIHGTVTDPASAAIVDAEVTLTNLATHISRLTKTSDVGIYNFPFVDAGEYKIVITKAGFQTSVFDHVKVEAQANVPVDATLKVGNIAQQVTVSAETQGLDTATAGISGVVSTTQLEQLPNNGQQFAQLIRLQPGVVAGYLSTGSSSGSVFGGSGYISGRRIGDNVVYIDGAMFYDPWSPSQTVSGLLAGPGLSQDAIEEFLVVGNNPKPDEGFTAGGRIDLITKSGGNSFHGSAYEYIRNNVLDARDFFVPKKLPLKRNLFGGSVGGPVRRDKSFFFLSYEGMRQRKFVPQQPIVPTPRLLAAIPGGPANNYLQELIENQYPLPVPGTYSATALVAPFVTSSNAAINYNLMDARWDYKINEKHMLTVRYIFNSALGSPGAVTSTGVPTTDGGADDTWQQPIVSVTSTFTPNLANEARIAYHREFNEFGAVSTPDSLVNCCGIAKSLMDPKGLLFLTSSGTGLTGAGPLARKPQFRTDNVYQADDSLTATRGRHLFTVGGTLMIQQVNDYFPQGLRAQATFVGFGPPFDTSANGLTTGKVFSETQTVPLTPLGMGRGMSRKQFALFGQDKWQIKPNLTLNLGLRYEFVGRPSAANSGFNNLYQTDASGNPIPDASITNIAGAVLRTVGSCSGCLDFAKSSNARFAPRVGIAWRPIEKLVLRAGYGMQYGEMIFNLLSFNRANPGFTDGVTIASAPFALNLVGLPASKPLVFAYNPGMDRPYTEDWNFSTEYALSSSTSFETSYVGNRGKKLLRPFAPNFGSGFTGTRPNLNFGQVTLWDSSAASWYDALQLSLKRRFSTDLALQVSYTYAKSLDTASGEITAFSDFNYPTNPLNPGTDKGRSDFDLRHVFVTNFVYELPVGKGKRFLTDLGGIANGFLGGWQVSGVLTVDSGQPFTLLSGVDVNKDGIANDRARALAPLSNVFNTSGLNKTQFLNPAAVGTELSSTTGIILGRNIHDGPNFRTFDFGLSKRFSLFEMGNEPMNLEIRALAYNIFNRPNFAQPNTTVSSPAFGKITNTVIGGRQLEFAAKFTF